MVEFERGKVVRDELQGAYIEQPVRDEELWGGNPGPNTGHSGYGATYPGGRGRGF